MKSPGYAVLIGSILSLAFAEAAWAQNTIPAPPGIAQIIRSSDESYRTKRYVEAAALGLYAVERGATDPNTLYNTACCLALAGDSDRAFALLTRALNAGYTDAAHIRIDDDLVSLRGDKRFAALLSDMEKADSIQRKRRALPDRAGFVTEDIPRFWAAFDKAVLLSPDKRAAVFQKEYLDKASPGMQEWIVARRVTVETLTDFVNKNIPFFVAARPATLGIAKQRDATIAAFRKFKTLYSDAQFPTTVFSIGAFYGGGTVSANNLLMSAEMYTLTAQPPTMGLSMWQKSVLSPADDLPFIIAHEMIHFQQRYSGNRTLLLSCVQEGSADFLGEMCSGGLGAFHEEQVYPYGNSHEKELWERFQQDKDKQDKQKEWLYKGSGEGIRPDDLGYYMGYKICEAYYKNAADKTQAIRDILHITDFDAFLKASRYGEKFGATVSGAKNIVP